MANSSSPPKQGDRPTPPRGFLPLNPELMLSPRKQSLAGLIKYQSASSFNAGSPLKGGGGRRQSMLFRDEESGLGGDDHRNMSPRRRSRRLIGESNPRYNWEQYRKSEEELKHMSKPLRKYYTRTNHLIDQYIYIDRLLDSSLPHDLIQEYHDDEEEDHIQRVNSERVSFEERDDKHKQSQANGSMDARKKTKRKRTPKDLYRLQEDEEARPLLLAEPDSPSSPSPDSSSPSDKKIVQMAIYINLLANSLLLVAKIAATILTSSLSILASLVDAVLDFLSTGIVWTTTHLISRRDQYSYPVGRRRLEPIGVLVFSVIMITSFSQVLLESCSQLLKGVRGGKEEQKVVQLTLPAGLIMGSTVLVKGGCWFWCRLVKNSSVQALAMDARTDVVFNTCSIIFPLVGAFAKQWWLDPLGGLVLSLYIIITWSLTSLAHIRNLTGAASSPDQRTVLLYLTMRFATAIQSIQNLQAYHAGDGLIVEVDVVLHERMELRDAHDLGESLQYLLESVPGVERGFVHLDYRRWNLPTHIERDD
ncbi:MAG: hypothetical protein M1823_001158 [Watsoniomyces obsoletus]|nr:MAG: hypothetical protein M1823_001158 [Watsoniomyces obsoletus]